MNRMSSGTWCRDCGLMHIGIRPCYRAALLAALGLSDLDAREDRTLRWLAGVIDYQGIGVLGALIIRSQENAIALAASRGGAVTPSACTDGQAVTKGEAPKLGASPLEAASVGSPEYQAALARIERNWCSCGGVCPDCRRAGDPFDPGNH